MLDAGYDCAGNCLFDSDGDDICDWIELEALIEALTAGIYCGEGTLWVEAAQTCLPKEMCVGDLDGRWQREELVTCCYFSDYLHRLRMTCCNTRLS